MSIEKSEQINELATALAKAQGEIAGAEKDSQNPHFRSSFASLASVRDAFRDPLAKHGLSVVQLPERVDNEVAVRTMLMHTSGQFIACRLSAVPVKHDPQGVGSCISYLRRYSLMSVIGIAPEDDDGNAASETPNQRKPQQRRGNDAPTTAQSGPPSAAPSSVATSETDEAKIARWTSALNAAHTLAELKQVGTRISAERLPDAVRLAVSAVYSERTKALKPKKAPGPCSACGDKEHAAISCPSLTPEERAELLRAAATGDGAAA